MHKGFSPVKNWFANCFQKVNVAQKISIPIHSNANFKKTLPVHFCISSDKKYKIDQSIIDALGGISNIETYHEIPNSRRIRLTIINPSLIDNDLLEELDVRMFIRIGKRIVHIIP